MSKKNTYNDDIITGKPLSHFWKRLKETFATRDDVNSTIKAALDKYSEDNPDTEPIVDVEFLPTENIDQNVFYRTGYGIYWFDGEWHVIPKEISSGGGGVSPLPTVTPDDEGKFLKVEDGKWVPSRLPVYDGVYEITPSASDEQMLHTAQTFMDADVVVTKIPYAEVDNTSKGRTVTIG